MQQSPENTFLPISKADMQKRGWDELDILFVSADAYVDHPSFAAALLGRLLEHAGFRVGILAQPDWRTAESFKVMGQPRLCTMIAGGTAQMKVYGNIMSLVDETGFATNTTLTEDYTFRMLFSGNAKLTDASGLLLPATTLTSYCYNGMFGNCTNLTAAPATLPAETLAKSCYNSMFYGCTSLTTAPALPAKTLTESCYFQMFRGCTNLSAVTCMAASLSALNCTNNWLKDAGSNVAGTKTFTTPSTTGWSKGNSGIPSGWTRVDAKKST